MKVGTKGRCQRCGGRIVLIRRRHWVHTDPLRRLTAMHAAAGPRD